MEWGLLTNSSRINRRIGGLENSGVHKCNPVRINRRIGGLEKCKFIALATTEINRRIGGLEMRSQNLFAQ